MDINTGLFTKEELDKLKEEISGVIQPISDLISRVLTGDIANPKIFSLIAQDLGELKARMEVVEKKLGIEYKSEDRK